MLYRYALFTVIMSVLPFLLIIYDIDSSWYSYVNDVWKSAHDFFPELNEALSLPSFSKISSNTNIKKEIDVLFTEECLKTFTGTGENKELYLVILGNVFDVTKGKKFYGPGQNYHAFLGKDASRAFITGDYTEDGLTDDVLDLSFQELKSLKEWLEFYRREYTYKGKLIGRYFDKDGNPTIYSQKLMVKLDEAEKHEETKSHYKLMFPPCNVEWTAEEGSRVWCSKHSGGIDRDWVGVPRKFFEPGASSYRCACVNISDHSEDTVTHKDQKRHGNIQEYDGCHPKSTSCFCK